MFFDMRHLFTVQIGAKKPRLVEPTLSDCVPRLAIQNFSGQLQFPHHRELLALSVVVETCKTHDRALASAVRLNRFDEVSTCSHPDDLPRLRNW